MRRTQPQRSRSAFSLGLFERRNQWTELGIAVVSHTIDEESWRPVDSAPDAAHVVFLHPRRVDMLSYLALQPRDIHVEPFSMSGEEAFVAQRPLILIQIIVHLPEPPLLRCRLSHLRCPLSLRVRVCDWEVPEDEFQSGPEFLLDPFHNRIRRPTVGTLIVSILQEYHWS